MKIYNSQNKLILEVEVDDNSYRNRAIMGDHALTLYYSLAEHVELPIGAYTDYEGERYYLLLREAFKMKHSRYFEYTVTMQSDQGKASIWKFRNAVDGRLKFSLTAKPREHLQMLVDNLNMRDPGWTVGECIEDKEHLISYDHAYCIDALSQMASEFDTEYEFNNKVVSLRKIEHNKNYPLALSYGRGNGFKPNIGRSNSSDTPPVEILFVQGGDTNIDRSKYPTDEKLRATSNGCLLLPVGGTLGYDGVKFEDEDGYNEAEARHYIVDDLGLSIRNIDHTPVLNADDSLDRSDDYPKRIGTVTDVVCVDEENNFWDFIDNTIPEDLEYNDYLIDEENMTVIFQSGELVSRELEVKYIHKEKTVNGVKKQARRFEIVPQEIDGVTMPGDTFIPKKGDTYAIFNVMLPQAYINAYTGDNPKKEGAEWDMFRAAVKYLFENEEQKFSFSGELDGIWAKKDWNNIGAKIVLGGYIKFSDDRFQQDGVLVRITGIKDYINKPHSPKIELSNDTITPGFTTTMQTLESQEVLVEDYHREALQYTKRRFRDAKETMEMIQSALSDNFTNSINPVTIETMQMLVGDERLQYQFVKSATNPTPVAHNITWDSELKQLRAPAGIIQHQTLGISSLSSSHQAAEYHYWSAVAWMSAYLDDTSQKYYLYLKATNTQSAGSVGTAEFRLETEAHDFDGGDCYWLLVGVLNSEYEGERSFVTLYGFTEVLPGRITTDRIVSGAGTSYFDMLNNAMKLGDVFDFNSAGDGQLRLKGTIVQSQGGEAESPIGCYRGVYNNAYTYYTGDEVTYQESADLPLSTYRRIGDTPTTGIAPTNTLYWTVIAQGVAGETGADGKDGSNGKSPVMVYRGIYSSSKTYYGNDNRLDVVKLNDTYYIARIDAGEFSQPAPPDTSKWNSFGASFESVATNLLLAEGANIGDWFISGGKIVSTLDTGDIIILDAKNNHIQVKSSTTDATYNKETLKPTTINLDASRGIVEATTTDYKTAYLSPSGIFANRAATQCVSATTGCDQRAAIVGLGYGSLNKSEWASNIEQNLIAGIYGYASNSGTAPSYGGYFHNLRALGLSLGVKYITSNTSATYLTDSSSLVVGFYSERCMVYLPAASREGQTIFFKQWWTGSLRIYPRSGQVLYDDHTSNDYYDCTEGQQCVAHFIKASINGTNTEVWLISNYKF